MIGITKCEKKFVHRLEGAWPPVTPLDPPLPKLKIHIKHEAAYLVEEYLLSHVCKQTDNKFEVRNEI